MKRIYIFLTTILLINILYGQGILEQKMKVYEDSVNIKNYGMVGLFKNAKGIEKFAIGKSSINEKMTENQVFNIGSLTKTFTAVLILQEVEKGNLKLTDSLSTFFPKELCYNKNVDLNITIEQLLRHRSGLGEIVVDSLLNIASSNPHFEYNYTFLLNKIPKPTSKANATYKYCNTNYILLGYILEVLNDMPYSAILNERIFKTCKMTDSYAYYSRNIKNVAHPILDGIDLSNGTFFKYYQSYAFSAGGISSNTDDLFSFFNALYNFKLISKDSFEKMITFSSEGYGMGMQEFIFNKKQYIGHGGDNLSFKVRNFYNPKTKDILILMANQYEDKYIMKVAKKILN